MPKRFFTWLLIFFGLTLLLQSFQQAPTEEQDLNDLVLTSTEDSYSPGEPVSVLVQNNTDAVLEIPSLCPSSPLGVEYYNNGVLEKQSAGKGLYVECLEEGDSAKEGYFPQPTTLSFPPGESVTVDLSPWKDELFTELGLYRVSLSFREGEGDAQVEKVFMTEFSVEERGFFSSVAFHLFYRPIFNFLLFLTTVLPGKSFGFAVIVLTVIIRLILLIPNQKALKSQRAMMKIQPEIEAIKNKYKGNQEMISKETMALWKKHRVNPVGGCLPLLIQMPILISLFYVVKSGFSPYQGHMIYSFLNTVDLASVNTHFLGILELREVNFTWLPLLVGLLQFSQLRLSFSRRQKARKSPEVIDVGEKKKDASQPADPMQMMTKSMMYFMPVMIALMTASLPSGVGIYLVISTLFGIGQQFTVNRSIQIDS